MTDPTNSKDDDRAAVEERIRKHVDGRGDVYHTDVFYEHNGEIVHYQDVECGGHATIEEGMACAIKNAPMIRKAMHDRWSAGADLLDALALSLNMPTKKKSPPKIWVTVMKYTGKIVEFT